MPKWVAAAHISTLSPGQASSHRRENYEDWCNLGQPILHLLRKVSFLDLTFLGSIPHWYGGDTDSCPSQFPAVETLR